MALSHVCSERFRSNDEGFEEKHIISCIVDGRPSRGDVALFILTSL